MVLKLLPHPARKAPIVCADINFIRRLLSRPRTLQTQLIVFALLIALPIGAFSGYLLWRFVQQERTEFENQLVQRAKTLANDVDRQIEAMQVTVRTLATYPSLHARNWVEFHEQTRSALLGADLWLLLVEPNGRQILNTLVPFGTPLPDAMDKDVLRRVIQTRKLAVGNLNVGAVSRRPVLNIAVPILDGDTLSHIVMLAFTPDLIHRIMKDQALPQGWIGGLSDANAMVIGRSEEHEKFLNIRLPAELAGQRHRSGVFAAARIDGTEALRAVVSLRSADWVAAATVDRELATLATRQALSAMFLIGIILLSLAFSGAIIMGRSLSREISSLAKAGESLRLGRTVSETRGIVTEINHVAAVLSNASIEQRRAQLTTARLASIAAAALEALIGVDRNGTIETWNRAATLLLGYEADEIIGQPMSLLVPVDLRVSHDAMLRRVLDGRTVTHFDSDRRHKDGRNIPVSMSLAPILDLQGRVTGLVEAAHDISDRREWDRRQSLMSRELMHRVKNSLAVLQAIVRSTLRTTPDPRVFAEVFTGRLTSMAAAQDIVTDGEWKGADLERLARHQLAVHCSGDIPRIRMSGPPVQLPPDAAVPVGLALHELGTNAAKYGSLSAPDGTVDFSWSSGVDSKKRPTLHMEWREIGGPTVSPPQTQGFGGVLIDRGIGGAVVKRDFEPTGLVCVIDVVLIPGKSEFDELSLKTVTR